MSQSDKTKKVYVGMSGGVDSSVAAALLQESGHDVTGVFIKIWHPTISNCDWKAEMRDAMRACAHLEIPFKMIDLSDLYFERVIGYMISEYKVGRTPNPDVMCNDVIKFGAFYDWAIAEGVDYVATGHYAQNISTNTGDYVMQQGVDAGKDQTYFLWRIKKEQLEHVLFPVGSFTKKEIRAMAEKFALPNAAKKDSQGLCFVGDIDVKQFLQNHIDTELGDVLSEQGEIIGVHDGAVLYTIGERHGFILHNAITKNRPHFVIDKNIHNNTITVSDTLKKITHNATELSLEEVNVFIAIDESKTYYVMCRYHAVLLPCTVKQLHTENQTLQLHFTEAAELLATGQSVVLYGETGLCVAGGVVSSMK